MGQTDLSGANFFLRIHLKKESLERIEDFWVSLTTNLCKNEYCFNNISFLVSVMEEYMHPSSMFILFLTGPFQGQLNS